MLMNPKRNVPKAISTTLVFLGKTFGTVSGAIHPQISQITPVKSPKINRRDGAFRVQ